VTFGSEDAIFGIQKHDYLLISDYSFVSGIEAVL
jgi:hypothetical protein